MSDKFIVHIHDAEMTVGEAIKALNKIDYDDIPFEPICAWKLNRHYVVADANRNNKSVRFDIYKEEK